MIIQTSRPANAASATSKRRHPPSWSEIAQAFGLVMKNPAVATAATRTFERSLTSRQGRFATTICVADSVACRVDPAAPRAVSIIPALPACRRCNAAAYVLTSAFALARGQLDDRDHAPSASGPRTVSGICREDPIRELPDPRSLRLVIDDLRVEWPPAELHVGMDAEVVEPRRVVRQTQLRGDDRHPLPVVEVDDAVASRPAGSRAARLEQRRREQQAHSDPSSADAQQERVELPHDTPREPAERTRPDEPRVGAVDDAPPPPGIDVWKVAFRHEPGERLPEAPS